VEGKNRQVRRMTAAIGHPTLRLRRVQIGQFKLGDLPPGQWKRLTAAERTLVLSRAFSVALTVPSVEAACATQRTSLNPRPGIPQVRTPKERMHADFPHQGNKGNEEFCCAPTGHRASKMKDGTDFI
jgi:hypothetical protein